MTTAGIPAAGLTGVLRTSWVRDQLAHVLHHGAPGETSGTWTGLACPDHGLPLGADVDPAILQRLSARGEIADLTWEAPADFTAAHGQLFHAAIQAHHAARPDLAGPLWQELQTLWCQAWAANYAALELLQNAGLTRFSPVTPQRWVVASFEHHSGLHGVPAPHVHNIVPIDLTTGPSAPI
jgi:hypothetical protein